MEHKTPTLTNRSTTVRMLTTSPKTSAIEIMRTGADGGRATVGVSAGRASWTGSVGRAFRQTQSFRWS
jgi:hypothetical protein